MLHGSVHSFVPLSFARTSEIPLPTIQLLNGLSDGFTLVLGKSLIQTLTLSLFHACLIVGCKPEVLLCLEAQFAVCRRSKIFAGYKGSVFSTPPHLHFPFPFQRRASHTHTTLWADLTCRRLLS